jgi:succinate dehydrogenase flavin-adding protein (antitoxin of CptAB toxin-antitoxin module)
MDFYNELYADRAEDTVRQVVGEGDPDMAKWLLERTRAEKYSNKQKVDTDVRVTVKVQEF